MSTNGISGVGQTPVVQDTTSVAKRDAQRVDLTFNGDNDIAKDIVKTALTTGSAEMFGYFGVPNEKMIEEYLSNHTFELDENDKILTATSKRGVTTIIKYDDVEQLKTNIPRLFSTRNFKAGEVEFDLRNKKTTYDGVLCTHGIEVNSADKNVVIQNSELRNVRGLDYLLESNSEVKMQAPFKGKLTIENVSVARRTLFERLHLKNPELNVTLRGEATLDKTNANCKVNHVKIY